MNILITIPHYFDSKSLSPHGSGETPKPRIDALENLLLNLYSLFSPAQCMLNIKDSKTEPVNQNYISNIDIVICTANNKHILKELSIPQGFYRHKETKLENPLFLGYECQRLLSENLGKYDYYCYMEDDLIIHDALFFEKIKWFNSNFDEQSILLPNRYETGYGGKVLKAYVDGDINLRATEKFQNINESPNIITNLASKNFTNSIKFKRPLNPHSGCFFLNQNQMSYWAKQTHFLDMDARFISPLESAATLGIMKTFKIYKPASENANFLEIQHYGKRFLSLIAY